MLRLLLFQQCTLFTFVIYYYAYMLCIALIVTGFIWLDMCGSRIYPYHHQERKKEVGREGCGWGGVWWQCFNHQPPQPSELSSNSPLKSPSRDSKLPFSEKYASMQCIVWISILHQPWVFVTPTLNNRDLKTFPMNHPLAPSTSLAPGSPTTWNFQSLL